MVMVARDRDIERRLCLIGASLGVFFSSGAAFPLLGLLYPKTYEPAVRLVPALGFLALGIVLALLRPSVAALWRAVPAGPLLVCWWALSTFWTIGGSTTVNRITSQLSWLAVVLCLIPSLDLPDRLLAIWVGMNVGLVHSALLLLVDSPSARLLGDESVNGSWIDRNLLSHAGVFTIGLSFALLALRRRWTMPALASIGLAMWLIARSGSRTPLVAAPIVVCAVLALAPSLWMRHRGQRWLRVSGPIGIIVFAAMVSVGGLVFRSSSYWVTTFGEASFRTRVTYWKHVVPYILERPVTGWGFGNVLLESDRGPRIAAGIDYPLAHLHNGFVEAVVDGGVVALVLLLWVISAGVRKSWRRCAGGSFARGAVGLLVIVMAVVINMTEPDFFSNLPSTFIVLVAIAAPVTALRGPRAERLRERRVVAVPRVVAGSALAAAVLAAAAFGGSRVAQASERRPLPGVWSSCGPLSPTMRALARRLGGGPNAIRQLRIADPAGPIIDAGVGRPLRGYDRPAVRELRLQCGFLNSPSEAPEALLRSVLVRRPSMARLPELDMLGRELAARPELVERFSTNGRFSVPGALKWASFVPADDASFSALAPGWLVYPKVLREIDRHSPWWTDVL